MLSQYRFVFALFSLFVFASAQDEQEKVPSLKDAQTLNDVYAYMQHEYDKIDRNADEKHNAAIYAVIDMAAGEKVLEIAKQDWERNRANDMKFSALRYQIKAEIEGAEQKLTTFLDEVAAKGGEFLAFAEEKRFRMFAEKAWETVKTPEDFNAFKTELKSWINRKVPIPYNLGPTWFNVGEKLEIPAEECAEELIEYVQSAECILSAKEKKEVVEYVKDIAEERKFHRFSNKALETVNTPETFATFKAELIAWINRGFDPSYIALAGLTIAEKNEVPAEDFIRELTEYVRSPECALAAVAKRQAVAMMEKK
jgi:hypothetical protein